jgi:hypothetical protein
MEPITATELMELAEKHGYPRLVVEYPDGKSRFHIAGSRDGWKHALPYLSRDGVLKLTQRTLLNPQLSEPPPLPAPPPLPEMFREREPLVWNLLEDWFTRAFQPDDLQAIRVMLAYAEACGYPELTLGDYNYTIRGDMAGWITAAKLMCGTPAVARTTQMLHTLLCPQEQPPFTGE